MSLSRGRKKRQDIEEEKIRSKREPDVDMARLIDDMDDLISELKSRTDLLRAVVHLKGEK